MGAPMHGRRSARLALPLVLALVAPATATAGTITVTTTEDGGACDAERGCTLRGALSSSQDGDVIRVPAGQYQLTQGELAVNTGVTITGDGAGLTQILGGGGQSLPVFTVDAEAPVEIAHLTIRDGIRGCGSGGNLQNSGTLYLHHVAVRDGVAANGGGIANFGRLSIDHSLIDGNLAGGCDGAGLGGGIETSEGELSLSDSTVAFNAAGDGGGIAMVGATGTIARVTLARNRATGGGTGGLGLSDADVTVRGSLIAANAAALLTAAGDRVSNCDPGARPVDAGGNLADSDECFAGAPADPGLSDALVSGLGETPLLTVPAASPAIDAGGDCRGSDQREATRPQGDACDAGAYELSAPALGGGLDAAGAASFSFSAEDSGTAFECRLDRAGAAGPWEACVSPKAYGGLTPGTYVFRVRPAGASAETTRTFTVAAPPPPPVPAPAPALPAQTPAPAPTATPTPRYRSRVVVKPTSGAIRVKLPGSRRYVDLRTIDAIPLGASIDARKGRVRLYAIATRGGKVQAASFYGGVFRVRQAGRVIVLTLRGPAPRCASASASASASSHKPKKKKRRPRKRRLWGSGKGSFRTEGKYSAATVRGTKWVVVDSCRSTTTRVVRGVVSVRDVRRHRTIVLRAGGRYVARKHR